MQKVSKQSLAMIALSILLAISIALTFTFAALSSSSKATGTVTFSGNVSVKYNGHEDLNGKMTFTVNYKDSENVDENTVTNMTDEFSIGTVAGSDGAYAKITFTYSDEIGVTVKVKNPFDDFADWETITSEKSYASAEKLTSKTIKVAEVLDISFDPNAYLPDNFEISIQVSADTRGSLE